jgi:osmotically-inducible protein OsmY
MHTLGVDYGQRLRVHRLPAIAAILALVLVWPFAGAGAAAVADREVTLAVERQLAHDQTATFQRVDVSTRDGIVTLSGSVDHLRARSRAAEIAMTVKGVRSVINNIDVVPVVRTDREIQADVREALEGDPATDAYDIQPGVREARVVLTGTVDSWYEKQLAAKVARGVKGVKAVANEIDLELNTRRGDDEIAAEIRRRLTWDVWVDDALIDIRVDEGRVALGGAVGSLAEKARALEDAWVTGVVAVDNRSLEVDWSRRNDMRRTRSDRRLDDANVRKALETAFSYDPRVAPFKIDVRVEDGRVTLSGVVDNLKARQAAVEDARHTAGVWMVRNHLKVRPVLGPYRRAIPDADGEIARKVRMALLRDPVIEQHEIAVTVYNYAVRLEGRVDTRSEKALAEDIASRVRGVAMVFNELQLNRKWEAMPDWEIEMQIEEELAWSPFLDADRVAVTVNDGVAALTGVVETLRERRAATENAYEGGARRVRNRLKVRYGPEPLRP